MNEEMSSSDNNNSSNEDINDFGAVKIADEVVAIVAGLAATEIEGVAGMTGGIAGGIAEMLGRKNLSKGVKVEADENKATIELYLVMDYGVKIPDVAWRTQENVKRAIETMTGLDVPEVNIHIQGVSFPGQDKKEDEIEEKDETDTLEDEA